MTTGNTIPPMDAAALASEILRRDRARMRNLAILTIALWIIAGLLIPSVFLPLAAKVVKDFDALNQAAASGQALTANDVVSATGPLLKYMIKVTLFSFFMAIAAAILASITSIALALTIRRSTLRQVSANLAEISEQLRQLKNSPS
jgi:ABC-type Fe3+ transport system permease subunit